MADVPPDLRIMEVEAPWDAPKGVIAFMIHGDWAYPRYFDRELLFCTQREDSPSRFIGYECVVEMIDGTMVLGILRQGLRRASYNLELWHAQTIEDVEIKWAAPVKWTRRNIR
jgi:hypothetical protein